MKITEISFDEVGFRNLHNLSINISPRVTVISGHNGIGKSTILGLIANGSELRSSKTLLGKSFRADFSEIFFLDYAGDFNERKEGYSKATLTYEYNEHTIVKECTVTGSQKEIINKKQYKPFMGKIDETSLTEKQAKDLEEKHSAQPKERFIYIPRMRVIPRTKIEESTKDKDFLEENKLGGSAKVGIPTLYLGMSRVSPIGEFETSQITLKSKIQPDEIREYIYEFFNDVIRVRSNDDSTLHSHSFAKNNKQSLVPNFDYSSLNISLGQDSLSSIVTAFASFKKLELELGSDYQGGILVIDEIEAGLHPKAQLKLMEKITSEARKLKLQIIATSHSLTIMKFILDKNLKTPEEERSDSLVYLMDSNLPRIMLDPTYTKIKSDMLLTAPPKSDSDNFVKIYFEDDEAKYFFEKILDYKGIHDGKLQFGQKLEKISLKIGCEILIKLAQADNYFKTAVLVADNDVASSETNRKVIEKYENFCVLPSSQNLTASSSPKKRTPEGILYDFLQDMLTNFKQSNNREFWNKSGSFTSDFVEENFLNLSENERSNRKSMKDWFGRSQYYFDEVNLVHEWCARNNKNVDNFILELNNAVNAAFKNLELAKEFEK